MSLGRIVRYEQGLKGFKQWPLNLLHLKTCLDFAIC